MARLVRLHVFDLVTGEAGPRQARSQRGGILVAAGSRGTLVFPVQRSDRHCFGSFAAVLAHVQAGDQRAPGAGIRLRARVRDFDLHPARRALPEKHFRRHQPAAIQRQTDGLQHAPKERLGESIELEDRGVGRPTDQVILADAVERLEK